MLKKIGGCLVGLTILSSFGSNAVAADVATTVKDVMTPLIQENHIPGAAVLLYVDGKPYEYYFGYANPKTKKTVTQKTIFELGSITKLMTSLLFAQQIDAAKIQLDDPLQNYLPNLPDAYDDITLKNLATHTAGFPFVAPNNVKTKTALQQYIQSWQPEFSADEKWIYSNIDIQLLGEAVAAKTHRDINQLFRDDIFKPLKMESAGLSIPSNLKMNYAQGHNKKGQPEQFTGVSLFPNAAAMKASAGDMQHFLKAAIGLPGTPDSIFYPMRMTQTAYLTMSDKEQGLGWQMHKVDTDDKIDELLDEPEEINRGPLPVREIFEKPKYDGDMLIDKTGATEGFRAYIAVIPNKKSGIIILTNKYITNANIVHAGREILFELTNLVKDDDEA